MNRPVNKPRIHAPALLAGIAAAVLVAGGVALYVLLLVVAFGGAQ